MADDIRRARSGASDEGFDEPEDEQELAAGIWGWTSPPVREERRERVDVQALKERLKRAARQRAEGAGES